MKRYLLATLITWIVQNIIAFVLLLPDYSYMIHNWFKFEYEAVLVSLGVAFIVKVQDVQDF